MKFVTVISRRKLLMQFMPAALSHPVYPFTPVSFGLSPDEDRFLNDLEYSDFLFFWEQSNPVTGLVKDRTSVRARDHGILASIAATGFGLTAWCIGQKRG